MVTRACSIGVRIGLTVNNFAFSYSILTALAGAVNEVAQIVFKSSCFSDYALRLASQAPLRLQAFVPLLGIKSTAISISVAIGTLYIMTFALKNRETTWNQPPRSMVTKLNQILGSPPKIFNQMVVFTNFICWFLAWGEGEIVPDVDNFLI
jgi:hypothetical protein